MEIQPYVFFEGRCEEAMSFYTDKLGAELQFKMHYKDAPPNPDQTPNPKFADMVMHASVKFGSTILMMSDDCMSESVTHTGFRLTLTGNDLAHAEKLYNALAEGGKVDMPWQATFWTKGFGMLTDKFGIGWMVMAPEQPN
jgi:PhnB protein